MVNNSVGGESVETVLTVTGQNYKLFSSEREDNWLFITLVPKVL